MELNSKTLELLSLIAVTIPKRSAPSVNEENIYFRTPSPSYCSVCVRKVVFDLDELKKFWKQCGFYSRIPVSTRVDDFWRRGEQCVGGWGAR